MDNVSEYTNNDTDIYEKICKKYNIPMIYKNELESKELFWVKLNQISKVFPTLDVMDQEILTRIYGGIRFSNKVHYLLDRMAEVQ